MQCDWLLLITRTYLVYITAVSEKLKLSNTTVVDYFLSLHFKILVQKANQFSVYLSFFTLRQLIEFFTKQHL